MSAFMTLYFSLGLWNLQNCYVNICCFAFAFAHQWRSVQGHHFRLRGRPCLGQTSTIIPQPTPLSPTAGNKSETNQEHVRKKCFCDLCWSLLHVFDFKFCIGLFSYKHMNAGFDFENRILCIFPILVTGRITLTKIEHWL